MNSIWASAVACEGASCTTLPPISFCGFLGAGLGDLEIGIGVELGKKADRNRVGGQTGRSRDRSSYKQGRDDVRSSHVVVSSVFAV